MRDTREYVIEGTRYPSPSEILDATGFSKGLQSIPPDILQAAAERGNRVHDWCESFLLGDPKPVPAAADEELRCSAFLDWMEEREPEVVDVEKVVFSNEIRVAGKLDILAEDDGRLSIYDIKTGSGDYAKKMTASYPVQQALYAIAVREMYQLDYYPARYILQLPKSGAYAVHHLDDPTDMDVAKAAAAVTWRLIDSGEVKLA
jgi:hypothetical protein